MNTEEIKEVLSKAIVNRKVVIVDYTSSRTGRTTKTFLPFVLGEASNGNECVDGEQVFGHYAKLLLENVHDVLILDDDIPADKPEKYEITESRWNDVFVNIKPVEEKEKLNG